MEKEKVENLKSLRKLIKMSFLTVFLLIKFNLVKIF